MKSVAKYQFMISICSCIIVSHNAVQIGAQWKCPIAGDRLSSDCCTY